MKKLVKSLSTVFCIAIMAFQCEEKDCCVMEDKDCPPVHSPAGTWRLYAYQTLSSGRLELDPDPDGRGVVFTFSESGEAGEIKGHTVANEITGSYQRDNCRFRDIRFGGTKVGEPNSWNSKVWTAMHSAQNFQLVSDELAILFNNNLERMLFRKQN